MTRLIIVRHGDTFAPGEDPRRIGARTDLPLTASGMAQAHSLGLHFASSGYRFARAFTSPLARTRQTAALLLGHLDGAPSAQAASWLTEIDHGPDEGAVESAVIERVGPEALKLWEEHGVPPVGWQVDREARLCAWRQAMTLSDEGDTLLVTSNGAARFALLSLPETARPPTLKLRTGAFGIIAKVDRSDDTERGWSVVKWNVRP